MRSLFAALLLCLIAVPTLAASHDDPPAFSAPGAASILSRHAPVARQNGRPAGCPGAWCGCWLARHLGMASGRALWVARAWARVGAPAHGPAPGVVAVWRHHVGIVRAVPSPGRIVLLSGNDGHRVRERERSSRGVIAWRHVGDRLASARRW
jgi:hypothetical protein